HRAKKGAARWPGSTTARPATNAGPSSAATARSRPRARTAASGPVPATRPAPAAVPAPAATGGTAPIESKASSGRGPARDAAGGPPRGAGGSRAGAAARYPPRGRRRGGVGGDLTQGRSEAERLRRAGVGRGLVQPLIQRAELGHQRAAAAPRGLLLGDQGVGGQQQARHGGAVLQRGARHPERV